MPLNRALVSRTVSRCISGWIALTLGAVSLIAQVRIEALNQPQTPVTDKNRIILNVVVTDKKGQPIPGLQAGDFTLLDNGQPEADLGVPGP